MVPQGCTLQASAASLLVDQLNRRLKTTQAGVHAAAQSAVGDKKRLIQLAAYSARPKVLCQYVELDLHALKADSLRQVSVAGCKEDAAHSW